MSDDDELEWRHPELEAARADVERAVQRYLAEAARQRGVGPYIALGWVVGVEATSADLDSRDLAIRETICPAGQQMSTSAGLGAWLAQAWL